MKKNLVYEDSYQILLKFQLLRRLLWKQFSRMWCNVCNTYLNKQIFVCVNWFRHMLAHVSAIACLSRQRLRYMLAYTHAWMTIWGARNVRRLILYVNMLFGHEKMYTKISNSWSPGYLYSNGELHRLNYKWWTTHHDVKMDGFVLKEKSSFNMLG